LKLVGNFDKGFKLSKNPDVENRPRMFPFGNFSKGFPFASFQAKHDCIQGFKKTTFICSSLVVATSPNTFDMLMSLTRITWTLEVQADADFLRTVGDF
jgi:hypothetical protein